MTTEQFWSLVENLPGDEPEEALRTRLEFLEPEELVSFESHFDQAESGAYHWDLWAVAYIIDGGCSNDGFMDFRYGLISRGRKVYEAAVKDADTLADVVDQKDGYIPNEAFGYVASKVYESKTGREIPREACRGSKDPAGEHWDFLDPIQWAKRLPRIWAKFEEEEKHRRTIRG